MRLVFLEVEDVDRDTIERLAARHEIEIYGSVMDEPMLAEVCRDAEVISPFIYSKIGRRVIDAAHGLRLITTRSTGYEHIDVRYAEEKGVKVCNVPQYGMNTVAEHAFALLLDVVRHLSRSWESVKKGNFSYEGFRGRDLKGKTLGVIGTGRIGLHAIRIAKGFEMDVLAYDVVLNREAERDLGFRYVDLHTLLERADVVTIHVPLLKDTYHLINKERVKRMKHGAIVINTARGGIVETDALVYGLKEGILGGVGLDVLEDERALAADHPLLKMKNVVISPHTAFYTDEAMTRILHTTFENIEAFEQGRPINTVTG
ncbi:MAG: NAD(P)-dependent oxidoreductase [Candidatus Thermoplasmatota archaeon]